MMQSPAMAKMLGQLKVKNAAAEARGNQPPAVASPASPATVHQPAQPGPAIPISQRPPHGAPISRMKTIAKPPVGHEKQSPGGLKAIASIHQALGADRSSGPSVSTLHGGTQTSSPTQPLRMQDGGVVPKKDSYDAGHEKAESEREETESQNAAASASSMGVDAAQPKGKKWGVDLSKGGAEPMEDTRKMSDGGVVPGKGGGDHVPALLEPGELVIPKDAAQRIIEASGYQHPGPNTNLPVDQPQPAHDRRQMAPPGHAAPVDPSIPPGTPGGEAGPAPGILKLISQLGHVAGQPIVPQGAGTGSGPDGGTENYGGSLGGSNPRRMRDGTK